MKIGVFIPDVRPEAGGASSLLRTIQKEIKDSHDEENEYVFLFFGGKNESKLSQFDGFAYLNLDFYKSNLNVKQRIKNKIKQKLRVPMIGFSKFDAAAKDVGIDLFWFTAPGIYDVSYPYIYTVWDLGHRQIPYFPEVSRTGWIWESRESAYQRMLYKASYIITGNEEGKKEILINYPLPAEKVRISPFPVASFCRGTEQRPSFNIPEQFFFYPAQFWPHKNHICILEALVHLRNFEGLQPTMFFTGSDKGNMDYIKTKIAEFNLQDQVKITGFLKDEELKYLYTHATAMVFASLMGPNNMPPIEASFLGCPVIITDLAGHKEQLEDSALYFNGYKPTELADQMKKILIHKGVRSDLIAREKELAVQFGRINYFSCIKQIIDEFAAIRRRWGKDFVHL